jgi:protein O-GlcNAc transferase
MELTLDEALQHGVEAHQAGQIQEAYRLYASVLKAQPNHAEANHNVAVLAVSLDKIQEALPFFKTALEANPSIDQFWQSYISALLSLDQVADAQEVLDQAKSKGAKGEVFDQLEQKLTVALQSLNKDEKAVTLVAPPSEQLQLITTLYTHGYLEQALSEAKQMLETFPTSVLLNNIAGASNAGLLQFDAAINNYKQVLRINPHHADAYYNMGIVQKGRGDLEAAIATYKKAIKIKPDYAEAYYNMGVAQQDQEDLDSALDSYKQAINIKPDYAQAYNNMGNVLNSKRDPEQAVDSFKQAIKHKPDYAQAYNNMGVVLHEEGDLAAAMDSYKQALKIKPNYADAYNNMGLSLNNSGDFEAALDSYKKAVKNNPDYADAYNNMGNTLHSKGDLEAAIQSYKQVLKIKPDHADAYNNMGNSLAGMHDSEAAIQSFVMALKYKPNHPFARAYKLHIQAYICDWVGLQEDQHLIPTLGIADEQASSFMMFGMMALEDAPERHRLRSEVYAKSTFKQSPLPLAPKPSQKPKRLRIGYFSGDFQNHPVMYALIEVLEQHNRALFEVYAYSFGPDTSDEIRQRVMRTVDVFNHVKDMDDQTIALLARQDKIDIAIDLTGYTKNGRTGIFAYRAAPVQIAMLGYPGTSGTTFIDYIMTDQTLLPTENQKLFSEKPIYMPYSQCSLEANIPLLDTTPTRLELGLPEEGFVFCAINSTYKITPAEFDIWMRLLRQVDDSVLWLLESNRLARGNLVKEAEVRGVDPKRLVFQPKMVTDAASQQQYLSQFRQADLYLDTFIYGAGSTAANALWAGLPVLTLIGQGMSTRMAASYLNSLGLSELITTTGAAYETLALELSKNPQRLALLKHTLGAACQTAPLFDSALQTKYLENGYQQAYQRYFDDQLPDAIFVPEHLL